jgi:hypothetical protein
MHQLPQTGYLRLPQIIGNAKAEPPTPALIPVSKSTWWQGVKDGRFPKSVKLSARTTAWRVEDICDARKWTLSLMPSMRLKKSTRMPNSISLKLASLLMI